MSSFCCAQPAAIRCLRSASTSSSERPPRLGTYFSIWLRNSNWMCPWFLDASKMHPAKLGCPRLHPVNALVDFGVIGKFGKRSGLHLLTTPWESVSPVCKVVPKFSYCHEALHPSGASMLPSCDQSRCMKRWKGREANWPNCWLLRPQMVLTWQRTAEHFVFFRLTHLDWAYGVWCKNLAQE